MDDVGTRPHTLRIGYTYLTGRYEHVQVLLGVAHEQGGALGDSCHGVGRQKSRNEGAGCDVSVLWTLFGCNTTRVEYTNGSVNEL